MLHAFHRLVGWARRPPAPTPYPATSVAPGDAVSGVPVPCEPPLRAPVRAPIRAATPRIPPRTQWKPARPPVEEHARRLLDWLQSPGGLTGELRPEEVQTIYRHMCADIGWSERGWNPVARELTKITTGKKVYRWFELEDGPHRLRVYPIAAKVRRTDSGDKAYRSIDDVRRAA